MTEHGQITPARLTAPFTDPAVTAKGEPRATVAVPKLACTS